VNEAFAAQALATGAILVVKALFHRLPRLRPHRGDPA
jgi:hypothetical protein